ncbi:hypothetical protein ACQUQU_04785 [Thalassolituus sp. LLYu03]|uniref:hypothetical protein n=1 Tax=Thalassolituus sp. LLYu03 TaxID=3421656 RepID=UPI003D2A9D8F
MQDFDTTSTQSLIDRYYEEEKAQRLREQTLAAFTIRMDANDLAMLNVIARRFRKNREEVAQEILSNALIDLFARIDGGERKLMARDADDAARSIADEIAEENGVMTIDVKAGVWANHDRQITKLERKKAKTTEKAEPQPAMAEEAVAADDEYDSQTADLAAEEAMEEEAMEELLAEEESEASAPAAAQPLSMFAG